MKVVLNNDTGETIGFPDEVSNDQISSVLSPPPAEKAQAMPEVYGPQFYDTTIAPALKDSKIAIDKPPFFATEKIVPNAVGALLPPANAFNVIQSGIKARVPQMAFRGTVNTAVGLTAGYMKWLGRTTIENSDKLSIGQVPIPGTKAPKFLQEFDQTLGEGLISAAETAQQFWAKRQFEHLSGYMRGVGEQIATSYEPGNIEQLVADLTDPTDERTAWEARDPEESAILQGVVEGVPALAGAGLLSLYAGPFAGAAAFGWLGAWEQYDASFEQGKSQGEAVGWGLARGVVDTVLMSLPITHYIDKVIPGRGILTNIATHSAGFGGTMAVMTPIDNVIAKLGGDKAREWHTGYVESILTGLLTGGLLSMFHPTRAGQIKKLEREFLKNGGSKDDLREAKLLVAQQLVDNVKVVDDVVRSKATAEAYERLSVPETQLALRLASMGRIAANAEAAGKKIMDPDAIRKQAQDRVDHLNAVEKGFGYRGRKITSDEILERDFLRDNLDPSNAEGLSNIAREFGIDIGGPTNFRQHLINASTNGIADYLIGKNPKMDRSVALQTAREFVEDVSKNVMLKNMEKTDTAVMDGVREYFRAQLVAAGRPESEANSNAEIAANMAMRMKSLGMDPVEWSKKFDIVKATGNKPKSALADPKTLEQASFGQFEDDANFIDWEPPRTKNGDIKNAPEGVTARNFPYLRKLVRQFVQEGTPGRYWYRDTARRILAYVRGDIVEAEKFIQLLAIYSPNTAIAPNTMFAVRVYQDFKSGVDREKIHGSTGDRDNKARSVLFDNQPWDGRKTNSFYINLMHEIIAQARPEDINRLNVPVDLLQKLNNAVTVDVWMLRAFGYEKHTAADDKGTGRYSFVENEIRRIAAELNQGLPDHEKWLPHEVQAALWTAIKGRFEIKSVKDKTIKESVRKKLSAYNSEGVWEAPTTADSKAKHDAIWRKHALEAGSEEVASQIESSKASFGDVMGRMTFNVTGETIPTSALGFPVTSASNEVKQQYAAEVLPIVNEVAERFGLALYRTTEGQGGYQNTLNPNFVFSFTPNKPKGDYDSSVARRVAAAIQYVNMQDAVPWFRGDRTADFKGDFAVLNDKGRVVKRFDTQAEAEVYAMEKGHVKDNAPNVRGGEFERGFYLKFNEKLTVEQQQEFVKTLNDYLKNEGGSTILSNGDIVVINYRNEKRIPVFTSDEQFIAGMERLVNEKRAEFGIRSVEKFGAQGEYGPEGRWAEDPSGRLLVENSVLARESPAVLEWLRDRQSRVREILQRYSAEEISRREEQSRGLEAVEAAIAGPTIDTPLFQKGKGPRGWVEFTPDERVKIVLTAKADASTFIHELYHVYWRDFQKHVLSGQASDQVKNDWAVLKKYVNWKEGQNEFTVEQQEKLARLAERYVREGNAPTPELTEAFANFKTWLSKIYKSVKGLRAPISDDVRRVMDRTLMQEDNYTSQASKHSALTSEVIKTLADEVKPKRSKSSGAEVVSESKTAKPKGQIKPVESKGQKLPSRHLEKAKRLEKELRDLDVQYSEMELADNMARAIRFVELNEAEAKRMVSGVSEFPKDMTRNAVLLAYKDRMREQNNLDEARRAEKAITLQSTRFGQEIASLKGQINELTPTDFVMKVIRSRMRAMSREISKRSDSDSSAANKLHQSMVEKVDGLEKIVSGAQLTVAEASKLADSFLFQAIKSDQISRPIAVELRKAFQSNAIKIPELYKMTSAERRRVFSKYAPEKIAREINASFEEAMSEKMITALNKWVDGLKRKPIIGKKADFKNTVFGELRQKIADLKKLGVEATAKRGFLEDLVTDSLGFTVTQAEMAEITRRSSALETLYNGVKDTRMMLGDGGKYWKEYAKMEKYIRSLTPASNLKVFGHLIARGSKLVSLASPTLNIESNTIQALIEAVNRRGRSGEWSGLNPELIIDHTNKAFKVFELSGHDMNRTFHIDDISKTLGEEVSHAEGSGPVRAYGRFFSDVVFKQFYGAPDVYFAGIAWGDAADLISSAMGSKWAKSKGFSPRGSEAKAKAKEIFLDAETLSPQTEEGQLVRDKAIEHALRATYQNRGKLAEASMGIRNVINDLSGDLSVGDIIMPFVLTPANVVQAGIDYSGLRVLPAALELAAKRDPESLKTLIHSSVTGGIGLVLATAITKFMDPDDYVGEFEFTGSDERSLRKAQNAPFNAFKIDVGGNKYWISTAYFGALAPAINGIMYAKKYGDFEGGTFEDALQYAYHYARGAGSTVFQVPGLTEMKDSVAGIAQTLGKGDAVEAASDTKNYLIGMARGMLWYPIFGAIAKGTDTVQRETGKDEVKRFKATIPGVRQELPEKISQVTGEPIKSENLIASLFLGGRFASSIETPILTEMQRLQKEGEMPSLGDIQNRKTMKELKVQIGEEKFQEAVKFYGKEFASNVLDLIESGDYSELTNEEKRKEIEKIREELIADTLEEFGYEPLEENQ